MSKFPIVVKPNTINQVRLIKININDTTIVIQAEIAQKH